VAVSASDSILIDSFTLTIGDIADADVDKLHALSLGVGWPHRAEDWRFLQQAGKGVVALDEIGRVVGSAMWFPFGPNFATIGMVITSPRLQANGTGQWLMKHVQERVGDRDLGLSATRAARRLYLSLDFTPESIVYQCQGEAVAPPAAIVSPGAALRPITPADLDAITELDRKAFGAERKALLAQLLEVSKGLALLREGRIEAFSLCRQFGRGHVIGPVVAATDADALAVVRPHVADHAGRFLRLDTRQKKGDFAEFLSRCGLPVHDTVTTMSFGRPWTVTAGNEPKQAQTTYALTSQALG